jgi:hypothetical protein
MSRVAETSSERRKSVESSSSVGNEASASASGMYRQIIRIAIAIAMFAVRKMSRRNVGMGMIMIAMIEITSSASRMSL